MKLVGIMGLKPYKFGPFTTPGECRRVELYIYLP